MKEKKRLILHILDIETEHFLWMLDLEEKAWRWWLFLPNKPGRILNGYR